jgi:DNA replication factor GINS
MMNEENHLQRIQQLVDREIQAGMEIQKIPKDTFKQAAADIKSLRNGVDQRERNLIVALTIARRSLMYKLSKRLLELRLQKLLESDSLDIDTSSLTPVEKYIVEPLLLYFRRKKRIESAIENGQTGVLEVASDQSTGKYTVVRFLQPMSAIVGVDLGRYGPFEKEDVAVLPVENAKSLIKQRYVVESWLDET